MASGLNHVHPLLHCHHHPRGQEGRNQRGQSPIPGVATAQPDSLLGYRLKPNHKAGQLKLDSAIRTTHHMRSTTLHAFTNNRHHQPSLLCPEGTSEFFTTLNLPGHHNYLIRVITQEKIYLWFLVQQISHVSIMGTVSWVVSSKNSYGVFKAPVGHPRTQQHLKTKSLRRWLR